MRDQKAGERREGPLDIRAAKHTALFLSYLGHPGTHPHGLEFLPRDRLDVIIRAAELADAVKFKGERRNVTSRLNGLLANAGLPGLRRL
eukprot:672708-Alexandrium_andersonii.AAC.1